MKAKAIEEGRKAFVVVFDEGEEVLDGLSRFASENDVGAADFTGIGAFRDVVLGFYLLERQGISQDPDQRTSRGRILGGQCCRTRRETEDPRSRRRCQARRHRAWRPPVRGPRQAHSGDHVERATPALTASH